MYIFASLLIEFVGFSHGASHTHQLVCFKQEIVVQHFSKLAEIDDGKLLLRDKENKISFDLFDDLSGRSG